MSAGRWRAGFLMGLLVCSAACGRQGEAGANGNPGATGPRGEQGMAGASGPVGPAGPTGPSGAAGTPGTPGPEGATGPDGATGVTGPMGPAGNGGTAPARYQREATVMVPIGAVNRFTALAECDQGDRLVMGGFEQSGGLAVVRSAPLPFFARPAWAADVVGAGQVEAGGSVTAVAICEDLTP